MLLFFSVEIEERDREIGSIEVDFFRHTTTTTVSIHF